MFSSLVCVCDVCIKTCVCLECLNVLLVTLFQFDFVLIFFLNLCYIFDVREYKGCWLSE